jgi:hypothetical protein
MPYLVFYSLKIPIILFHCLIELCFFRFYSVRNLGKVLVDIKYIFEDAVYTFSLCIVITIIFFRQPNIYLFSFKYLGVYITAILQFCIPLSE